MSFIVKVHEAEKRRVVAIIDKEIKDKVFEENNLVLNLKSNFYKGEEKSKSEIMDLINNSDHLNVVGNNIIKFLQSKGYVESIKKISDTPYAQVTFVRD